MPQKVKAMNNRNMLIIAIAALFIVGGVAYFMGSKSGGGSAAQPQSPGEKTAQASASGNSEPPPAPYQPEIVNELNARIKNNPKDWDAYSRMGDLYFGMKRFDEAISYYKKSIAINTDDVDSYNDIALSYMYTNRPVDALKYIDDGIKRNPSYQRIWLTKGFVLSYGLGRRDEAVTAWQKAASINPSSEVAQSANAFIEEIKKKK